MAYYQGTLMEGEGTIPFTSWLILENEDDEVVGWLISIALTNIKKENVIKIDEMANWWKYLAPIDHIFFDQMTKKFD